MQSLKKIHAWVRMKVPLFKDFQRVLKHCEAKLIYFYKSLVSDIVIYFKFSSFIS